jgi:hypothetical protein
MKRREEGWEGQGELDRGGEERKGKVQGKRRGKRVWEGRKERWGGSGMRDEWDWEGDGKGDWEANGSERVFDHFCRIYARGLSQIVSVSVSTRAKLLSLWKKVLRDRK